MQVIWKEIDPIKTILGMRAVDIATLARENADQNKMTQLKRLFFAPLVNSPS